MPIAYLLGIGLYTKGGSVTHPTIQPTDISDSLYCAVCFSKCHLKFSSKMIIFIKLVYLSSVISLKWQ